MNCLYANCKCRGIQLKILLAIGNEENTSTYSAARVKCKNMQFSVNIE